MKKIFRMAIVCALAGATLLYTGCTKDYSEEIRDINNRVTTLEQDTRVKVLQDRVDALAGKVTALETAKTQLEAAIAKKANQTDLEALQGTVSKIDLAVAQLQKDLAAAVVALNNYKEEVAATYATKEELNNKATELSAEITTKINEALKSYYTKDQIDALIKGYYTKNETKELVEQMLTDYYTKAEIAGILENYYDKKGVEKYVAGELENYYTKDQVFTKAEVENILLDYVTFDELDEILKGYYTKDDIDDIVEGLDGKIATVAANLATVSGDLAKEVEARKASDAGFAEAIQNVNNDIEDIYDGLEKMINAIVNTIQAIQFVPEFSDLCATLEEFVYNDGQKDSTISGPVVTATYEVTPNRLATSVKDDFAAGKKNVFMQMVTTGTRAAAKYISSEALEILSADNQTGYITVKARFAAEDFKLGTPGTHVVSLYIADPEVEAGIVEKDEEEIEEPTSLACKCSTYDPIHPSVVRLTADNFVYATVDGEDVDEYGVDTTDPAFAENYVFSKTVWMPWNDHSAVNFHEGFIPMVKVGGEYYTCADYEAKYFIPAGSATPTITAKDVKYAKNSTVETPAIEDEFNFTSTEAGVDEVIFSIADESVAAWLYDNAVSEQTWSIGDKPVFTIGDRFVIGWIETVTEIAGSEDVAWTYDFAVKHSDNPAVPYGKPGEKFENVQPIVFEEKEVDPTLVDTKELEKVTDAVVYVKDEAGEWKATDLTVSYDYITEETVDINVNGYEFIDEAVDYKVVAVFDDKTNSSRTTVNYFFSLGEKPVEFSVERTINVDYRPAVTQTVALAPEMPAELAEELSKYFTDDNFLFGFAKADVAQDVKVNGTAASPYTLLVFDEAKGVQTQISAVDVKAYSDTYVFNAVVTTWYGVTYKVKVNASLDTPRFKLDYWPDLVNLDDPENPYAIIKGHMEGLVMKSYEIDTDDLSKYFRIDGDKTTFSAEEIAGFTVKYKVVSTENPAKGYKNVPAVSGRNLKVLPDLSIPEEEIIWGNYSARDFEVVADFYCNGAFVNECPITLNILDPIAKFAAKEATYVVKRHNYEPAYAVLWDNLDITGVLAPEESLINPDLSIDKVIKGYLAWLLGETVDLNTFIWRDGNPYQVVLTFDDKDVVTKIGGVPYDIVGSKITYSAPWGVIVYNDESAWMQKPVEVTLKCSIQHKFNYLWPNQKTEDQERNHVDAVSMTVRFEQDGVTPTPNSL